MEIRHYTQIGLLQTGIVLGGYLLASASITLGYGVAEGLGRTGSAWPVDFVRQHGLLPLLIPVLWVPSALWCRQSMQRPLISQTIPLASGVTITVATLFLYLCAAAEGLQGPPMSGTIHAISPQ